MSIPSDEATQKVLRFLSEHEVKSDTSLVSAQDLELWTLLPKETIRKALEILAHGFSAIRIYRTDPDGFPLLIRTNLRTTPLRYEMDEELAKRRLVTYSTPPPQSHLADGLRQFRAKYPNASKAGFIMMKFGRTPQHEAIVTAIRSTLAAAGLVALRADDHEFNGGLLDNVITYTHGCGFGIAVFEQVERIEFNPNVALEIGLMYSLQKRVCILKDKSLASPPADILGKLYREFDANDASTIQEPLAFWLRDAIAA